MAGARVLQGLTELLELRVAPDEAGEATGGGRLQSRALTRVAIVAAITMGLFMICTLDAMILRELPNLIGLTERLAIAADLAWMCLAARALLHQRRAKSRAM